MVVIGTAIRQVPRAVGAAGGTTTRQVRDVSLMSTTARTSIHLVWRAEPVTVHIGPTTNPVRPAAPAAAGHGIHQVKDSGTTPATRCIARNV